MATVFGLPRWLVRNHHTGLAASAFRAQKRLRSRGSLLAPSAHLNRGRRASCLSLEQTDDAIARRSARFGRGAPDDKLRASTRVLKLRSPA